MRRRRKEGAEVPVDLFNPQFPEFVDDLSLSVKARVGRWNEWMETYYAPFAAAREKYESEHGVVFEDATSRYVPDAPFDPDEI